MTVPETLDQIREQEYGDTFPRALLADFASALVLFAAGFYGKQDAVWIADAGLRATCVDNDAERLAVMEGLYSADWEFVEDDAFDYAERAVMARQWDLVTVDCPSNLFGQCADRADLWCALAWSTVFLGTGADTEVTPPRGWAVTDVMHRSDFRGGVYWTVLERA